MALEGEEEGEEEAAGVALQEGQEEEGQAQRQRSSVPAWVC